jgi:hypothetical protein
MEVPNPHLATTQGPQGPRPCIRPRGRIPGYGGMPMLRAPRWPASLWTYGTSSVRIADGFRSDSAERAMEGRVQGQERGHGLREMLSPVLSLFRTRRFVSDWSDRMFQLVGSGLRTPKERLTIQLVAVRCVSLGVNHCVFRTCISLFIAKSAHEFTSFLSRI